ncbi:hypothetical protein EDB85DRAFT_1997703 [Lactarius pseudohatsudake]|nr:hypothetical protein EDB85DRAFT_1997703 [Lactarius pseudohatsudake]
MTSVLALQGVSCCLPCCVLFVLLCPSLSPLVILIPGQLVLSSLRTFIRPNISLRHKLEHILTLPTIQNLVATSRGGYHLILAVLLILKHATFLRLSNMSPESALTHAEVDYRVANVDSTIRQHLSVSSQERSDELFGGFIMAVDVTCTHAGFPGDGGE